MITTTSLAFALFFAISPAQDAGMVGSWTHVGAQNEAVAEADSKARAAMVERSMQLDIRPGGAFRWSVKASYPSADGRCIITSEQDRDGSVTLDGSTIRFETSRGEERRKDSCTRRTSSRDLSGSADSYQLVRAEGALGLRTGELMWVFDSQGG